MGKQHQRRAALVAAATFALIGAAAHAATYTNVTYTGASGGAFGVDTNWNGSPVRVPGTPDGNTETFDNAVISNTTVNVGSDLSGNTGLAGVSVSNSTFNVNSGGSLYQDYALNWDKGWFRTSSNSTVNINNGGTISAYGTNLNGGTMNVATGGQFIARGHYQELTGGVQLNIQGGLFAGGNTSFVGMNAAGATITLTDGILRGRSGIKVRNGSINVDGGSVYVTDLRIGESATYNTAMIDQTAGTVYLASKDGSYVGVGDAGDGLYQISGGTITMSSKDEAGVTLGHGDGIRSFRVGGGAGNGRFRIIGNDATVDIATSQGTGTRFTLASNGTLEWVVDDSTVTKIGVRGTGSSKQTASLAGVIDLNLALGYTPAGGATYDLLTATHSILDAGYSLDPADVGQWSLALIGTAGSGQTLQATYLVAAVPEPATIGLLGLASLGLLRRKSRSDRNA